MGTGQMMLVMLTVILFTSIINTTLSNLFSQIDYIYESMLLLQAEKIADKYINMIEMRLKSGENTFAQINSNYSSHSETITISSLSNITYNVFTNVAYSNRAGDTSSPDAFNRFQRFDVRVNFVFGDDTLFVGTAANPISAVFADPGI